MEIIGECLEEKKKKRRRKVEANGNKAGVAWVWGVQGSARLPKSRGSAIECGENVARDWLLAEEVMGVRRGKEWRGGLFLLLPSAELMSRGPGSPFLVSSCQPQPQIYESDCSSSLNNINKHCTKSREQSAIDRLANHDTILISFSFHLILNTSLSVAPIDRKVPVNVLPRALKWSDGAPPLFFFPRPLVLLDDEEATTTWGTSLGLTMIGLAQRA